ncbi:hypothetical protein Pcinc_036734, partial [Petrolisthes cinctipes]
ATSSAAAAALYGDRPCHARRPRHSPAAASDKLRCEQLYCHSGVTGATGHGRNERLHRSRAASLED